VSMRSFSAARTLLVALYAGVSATDDPFVVTFDVTLATGKKDSFDLEIQPEWAPLGAARFKELVDAEFFTSVRFFRVLPGFMAQFGIHGKPEISSTWRDRKLTDDPVAMSNKRGYISFATSGTDSRTTQMFINYGENANLDGMGFSPFGKVLGTGMDVVDQIFSGHGESPDQGRIQSEGNKYLKKTFPKLSYINSVTVKTTDWPRKSPPEKKEL